MGMNVYDSGPLCGLAHAANVAAWRQKQAALDTRDDSEDGAASAITPRVGPREDADLREEGWMGEWDSMIEGDVLAKAEGYQRAVKTTEAERVLIDAAMAWYLDEMAVSKGRIALRPLPVWEACRALAEARKA